MPRKAATARVALTCALLAGANILSMQCCFAAESSLSRILPKDVSLANLAAFEKQFSADLPVGTSKEAVEAYLLRWELPHEFAGRNSPADRNTFFARMENIGLRLSFPASLVIKVHLSEMDRVERIEYRTDYSAP